MHTLVICSIAGMVILITALQAWGWRIIPGSRTRAERPKAGRFELMLPYLETTTVEDHLAFWNDSGRNAGIRSRLRDMTYVVQELQLAVDSGDVDVEDARVVYWLAFAQAWASVIAFIESGVCRLNPSIRHTSAKAALQYHWDLCLRASNLCLDSSANETHLFL